MTSLEIIAGIFGLMVILKMATLFFYPKWMKNFSKEIFGWIEKNSTVTMLLALIVAIVLGSYIFSELTIVQVAAVMLFTHVLIGAVLFPFAKDLDKLTKTMLSEKGIKKMWIPILIYVGLAIWVLYALFA